MCHEEVPRRRSRTRRSCRRRLTRRAGPGRRRRRHPLRTPSGRRPALVRDRVLGRRSSAAAVVLVPGDLVVVTGRGEHIQVAVAVNVRRKYRLGTKSVCADRVLDETAAGRRSRTRRSWLGRTKRRTRPDRRRRQRPPRTSTGEYPSAVVLIACSVKRCRRPSFSYQAILSSDCDAESTSRSPSPSTSAANTDWGRVRVSGDPSFAKARQPWVDGLQRELPAAIFVPGDFGVKTRRGEDVQVAVPVDIRGEHRKGAIRGGADRMPGEDLPAEVLVPSDPVVIERRGEHVLGRRPRRRPQRTPKRDGPPR